MAAVIFVSILTLSVCAYADYSLVGKIPAPDPHEGGARSTTGLATAGENLFATVVYDTISYVCLIRPSDGLILDSYKWDILYKELGWPYFDAAAYEGGYIYWVADGNGAYFLRFEFDDANVNLIDVITHDRITAPTGLVYEDPGPQLQTGGLWITDCEYDSLFLMSAGGYIYQAYSLEDVAFYYGLNATSVTMAGDHLFMPSGNYPDSLFETTKTATRVDAHLLSGLGQMDVQATTFHDGLLYASGFGDSILIFSTGSYADSVPEGDSVVVEVVEDGLEVAFDSVAVAGSLYTEVLTVQPCPPPGGVTFFSDFYDVSTTAEFDYITQVTLMTDTDLPPGVRAKKVRVFVRPSGECTLWRDVTVASTEIIEEPRRRSSPFAVRTTRTRSEEDEFSVFVLGEDNRRPFDVITLKFAYLDSSITKNQQSIPEDTYNTINNLLDDAEAAFQAFRHGRAAMLVERLADIVRDDPAIPHRYDPEGGVNVAGRIISRAHTLSFSLRLLIEERELVNVGPRGKTPPVDILESSGGPMVLSPNPSESEFAISFVSSGKHPVSLSIYSVQGELVRTLLDGSRLAGSRTVTWDGHNEQGLPVAAGTYFAVLRDGESAFMTKMVLRK
jgi:hypothetical protein